MAALVSWVSSCGSTCRNFRPNESWFVTPSLVSRRYVVSSAPVGSRSV
jgi:hypothetical protein